MHNLILVNIYVLTFEHLDKIEENLNYLKHLSKANEWILEVAILIIFHQSLPNSHKIEKMNSPLLPDEKIKSLFDIRMIELMRLVMLNDSAAHSCFKGESWAGGLNFHLDKCRELFGNYYKICL
jgi:hypothetical protein